MLLNVDKNAKTVKGQKKGFETAILYLAPSDESGVVNVCPFASKGCREACLYTAGRGRFDSIKQARINKTVRFQENRVAFVDELIKEIGALSRRATKNEHELVVRLNGTSDVAWERLKGSEGKTVMECYPHIQFYDYTKIPTKALNWANGKLPTNYHITFSWNEEERNHTSAKRIAEAGGNIAVVFSGKLPDTFLGLPVVNGDENDLRFLDQKGCIVGLKAKGLAKKDESGFVVDSSGVA